MTAAILDIRRNVRPTTVRPNDDVTPIRVRPVVIGDSANAKRPLICRWRHDTKGRLACAWEPDIGPRLEHLITANASRQRLPKFVGRARRIA
ncbi:MAG TPA: hypothetical protein VGR79_05015 [Stellaceae bacterium]|nr:hypothetical protein [Stellaceae bacterium]